MGEKRGRESFCIFEKSDFVEEAKQGSGILLGPEKGWAGVDWQVRVDDGGGWAKGVKLGVGGVGVL